MPDLRESLKSIFDQLGTAKITLILETFYERMADDPMLMHFFIGKDLKHIAHQQAAFMMNAAGMTPSFQGRGPSTAHVNIAPIWQGHFDRRMVLLREVLENAQLAANLIQQWIDFERAFEKIVVSPN